MTGLPVGLLLEGFVAFLLLVTIAYCYVLNAKLTRLRAHQNDLRDIVAQLDRATHRAETAIGGLKAATMLAGGEGEADGGQAAPPVPAAREPARTGRQRRTSHMPAQATADARDQHLFAPPGAPRAPDLPRVSNPALERFRSTTTRESIQRRLDGLRKAS